MEPIATQTYYKVQREVNSLEQKNVEYERTIYLYEDKIVTKRREFPTDKVFDMSYRILPGEEKLLFFHTSQGVFSYTVKTDPEPFIQAFKKLEQKILQDKKTDDDKD